MELFLLNEKIYVGNLDNAGHIKSNQFAFIVIIKTKKVLFHSVWSQN